jgi:hypothetical protein
LEINKRCSVASEVVGVKRRRAHKVIVDAHDSAGTLDRLPQERRHLQDFLG